MPRILDKIRRVANSGRIVAAWMNLHRGGGTPNKLDPHASQSITRKSLDRTSPHVLIFAWSFPPQVNGGVYRPVSFVKYAVKDGWRVTVVSSPLEHLQSAAGMELLKSLPAEVRLFRAPAAPATSYRLLPKVDGGFPEIVTASQMALAACQANL